VRRSRFPYSRGELSGIQPLRALPDNWVDSATALERALAELPADSAAVEPIQFEMRSDHLFGQAWHLGFHRKNDDGRLTLTQVNLPASGDGDVQVSITTFDRMGMPTRS